MSVLITGSVAYDTVLFHSGAFGDRLAAGAGEGINATFLARTMRRDFGGCGANVAVSMRRLGGEPLLWGAVGRDGDDYLKRLEELGVDRSGLIRLEDAWTSQCMIFTDRTGGQIAAFHPGAAERSKEAPWPLEDSGRERRPKLAILSPGGRETTLHAARACTDRGIPFLFDVGQELPLFSGDELRTLLDMSFGIAYSDSEAEAFETASGLGSAAIARLGRMVVRTHGARGASLWTAGETEPQFVESLPVRAKSPVGAGDALRGGLMLGLELGLEPLEAVRLGAVAAARKISGENAQDYVLTPRLALEDYERMWGEAPAAWRAFVRDRC